MSTNCSAACQDPTHFIICHGCGARYHYGTIHQCGTAKLVSADGIVNPKNTFSFENGQPPKPVRENKFRRRLIDGTLPENMERTEVP
jgi:hypothetical protein